MISRILLPILVILLAAGVCLGLAGGVKAQTESAVPESKQQIQLSFAPLVKKISPAVVNIYTKREVSRQVVSPFMQDPFFAPFFQNGGGRMRKQIENSLGSGVIIDADGLIVTNSHVVRDATKITVVLSDGREFEGNVALKDDASDLSLVRVNTKGEKLPFVTLKPSESLEVGDLVLAIGNPFGVGQTVTSGIVSALARSSLNINDFNFFIQTDAAINPGNSGGPLVAMDGGVIGINSAIYSRDGGSLGIGFAIPSEMVISVIAAEKAGVGEKGIVRPWLGVTAQPVTSDIAESLGLPKPGGALVTVLHQASPMLKAGIKVGDVIVKMNGHEIHDPSEMKFRMATVAMGSTAEMEVIQKGANTKTTAFKVEAMPAPDIPPRNEVKLGGDYLLNGAIIDNMNPAVAVELGVFGEEKEGSVVVTKVVEGSRAARLLNPGDQLLEINGVEIKKTGDVEPALKKGIDGLSMTINSNGQTRKIIIR